MRILYISQDGEKPSGVTTYGCHTLVARADAHMLLLNAEEPPPAAPAEIHSRIHCVSASESHDVRAVTQAILTLLDSTDSNVVIVPNTGDTPWAATVAFLRLVSKAERARVRVLGILHSDAESQFAAARHHLPIAPVWTAVSRRCDKELRRRFSGTTGIIHLLHLPTAVPARAGAGGGSHGPLRLVYAGRLEEPQKRVSRLVAVFDALIEQGLSFHAKIAGDGPARMELAAAVAAGRAGRQVQFLGAIGREALHGLLLESDVFLLTSAYEGLPLALLESMAAGVCPVVMAIQSGLEDAITPGDDSIVVPQGDVAAMAAAIVDLDRDRERLKSLKRAARERIRREFSPERHFQRLAAIIDECFLQPPPNPDLVPPDSTAFAVARLVEEGRSSAGALAVYGAGMFGRKVVDACLDAGLSVSGWFDSDPVRWGLVYRGLTCEKPASAALHTYATFLVGSLEFAEEIAARIRAVSGTDAVIATGRPVA